MRLKADQPDVMIQPDLKDIGMLDRVDILEIFRAGVKKPRKPSFLS